MDVPARRHGDRGRGPLRTGPAPPAARPRGAGCGPGLLRPRETGLRPRSAGPPRSSAARSSRSVRNRCASPRSRGSTTASRWRRPTSSARRGRRPGLVQRGLPQLRVATLPRADHRELAVAARRHAEALLLADGGVARTGLAPPARWTAAGCATRRPARGRPGLAVADAGRVIAGSARGSGWPPRAGDAAAGRSGEAGPLRVLEPVLRRRTSSTCVPAAVPPPSRRCHGAPPPRSSWNTTPRPVA